MMTPNNLVSALRRLRVETGSIACLGCGHEHGCSVHGCAIIREAADLIGQQAARIAELEANAPGRLPDRTAAEPSHT